MNLNGNDLLKVVKTLINHFNSLPSIPKVSPFELLILTIISQNTNWRNTYRAFNRLKSVIELNPKSIDEANVNVIESALHVAGLYRIKAKILKRISRVLIEQFDGKLENILTLPLNEARKTLMSLPGIGPKTADIILLFACNKPVFPIDTHIFRVIKRMGFAPLNADYEEVRLIIESSIPHVLYVKAHFALIMLGRRYCRPRNPKCDSCPVSELCSYFLNRNS